MERPRRRGLAGGRSLQDVQVQPTGLVRLGLVKRQTVVPQSEHADGEEDDRDANSFGVSADSADRHAETRRLWTDSWQSRRERHKIRVFPTTVRTLPTCSSPGATGTSRPWSG